MVKVMIAGGITQEEIATVIGCTRKTLLKHFRHELHTAAPEANALVIASLHQMATKGKNVAAAIWWTKTRMGWREAPQELQHSGVDGAPIAFRWADETPPAPEAG